MTGFHRPVDVAILYGLGQKDRAQHIAREIRRHRAKEREAVTINHVDSKSKTERKRLLGIFR